MEFWDLRVTLEASRNGIGISEPLEREKVNYKNCS
jgi:hypothetical protein